MEHTKCPTKTGLASVQARTGHRQDSVTLVVGTTEAHCDGDFQDHCGLSAVFIGIYHFRTYSDHT